MARPFLGSLSENNASSPPSQFQTPARVKTYFFTGTAFEFEDTGIQRLIPALQAAIVVPALLKVPSGSRFTQLR